MNKKLIALMIVLLFSAGCVSIVFADDNGTETLKDGGNYIIPVSISDKGIEFSDGFTGFCLDLEKDSLINDDGFTVGETTTDKTENYVKLAIIECYKQGKENDIGKIISKIINNDLNSDDAVIDEILNSDDLIKDHEVVMIDNTTEATFDFELLKSVSDEKSDCLAYKVSLKTVAEEDASAEPVLGADDGNKDTQNDDTTGTENKVDNGNDRTAYNTDNTDKDTQTEGAADNGNDGTADNTDNADKDTQNKKDADKNKNGETEETNKTIINKTNTVIVNENNTTVINNNNVKTINKTAKEDPQNNTVDSLLKKAGNPIFILIVVIAILLVAVVVMKRKD